VRSKGKNVEQRGEEIGDAEEGTQVEERRVSEERLPSIEKVGHLVGGDESEGHDAAWMSAKPEGETIAHQAE
jgi:hypothetical protein